MSEYDQHARTYKTSPTPVRWAGLLVAGWALLPACGASEVTPSADGSTSSARVHTATAATPDETAERWNAPAQFTFVV